MRWGVVEDRRDPLKMGRCKVRIFGIHTDNTSALPTEDLPWAMPLQPIDSAAISGIGKSPTGIVEGTWVAIEFFDPETEQYPIIIGTLGGIPGLSTNLDSTEDFDQQEENELPVVEQQYIQTQNGGILTTEEGTPVTSNTPTDNTKVLGNLNQGQLNSLKKAISDRESSGGKNLDNGLGLIGKYQLGVESLEDQRYIKKGTSKSAMMSLGKANFNKIVYDSSVWTGKNGISSSEDFKNSQLIQEQTMDTLLQTNLKRLTGTLFTSETVPEKQAGILAVAHLKGSGAARTIIKTGVAQVDGFGTSSDEYYQLGYNSVVGKNTTEVPTSNNLSKPATDKNTIANDNRKYDVPVSEANKKSPVQQGFVDPNGKYPLENRKNEPDTSRLARVCKLDGTIVGEKKSTRITGIPVANGGSWDQPPIPYAAKYPFNHVYESESGHVMEFDDTPNNERINLYHTSGTFTEIDSLGNKVNKIVGSNITIIESDGLVYIEGTGAITVLGDFALKVGSSVQLEVTGDVNMKVNGNVKQSVTGDWNLQAGGKISLDGSNIFWNSGQSVPASSFTPDIKQILPVTLEEQNDMISEDTEKKPSPNAEPQTEKEKDTTIPENVLTVKGDCNFDILTYSTQISANYTLGKLCNNGNHPFPFKTGQHGLTDMEIACNLKQLCINVIEPLREKYSSKGFMFSNVFREAESKVSESKKISQHELGQAVDIVFTSFARNRELYYQVAQEIRDTVAFDQLLLEYRDTGSVWIHLSYSSKNNRKQILTLNNGKTIGQGLILLS